MEGVSRSTRAAPPSHLRLKIKSFSTLSSSSLDRYESSKFKAGDHHWKLALYPNGKHSGGKHHISLYLVLVDSKKEVWVNFSLFLFDHIRDKYLCVQGLSRFHEWQNEYGFDKFLPHATFKHHSNGYLNHGTCVFGAEVFPTKNEPNGSKYLKIAASKPPPFKYDWKMENFSKLDKEFYDSEMFTARGYDWKLRVCPKGYATGKGNSVSLYLQLVDSKSFLAKGGNVVVEFKLSIVDQFGSTHNERGITFTFNSLDTDRGFHTFLNLSKLNIETGYLVNDTCVFQVEIIVLGSSK